jgi:hypothetical protein
MPPMTRGEIDLANAIVRSLNRIADSQVKQTAMMEQMVELTQQLVAVQQAIISNNQAVMGEFFTEEPDLGPLSTSPPLGDIPGVEDIIPPEQPAISRKGKMGRRPIALVDTGDKL